MKEIWKDIKGYENLYQVSNLGRIKSLPRFIKNGEHSSIGYITKEKILKLGISKTGYYVCSLFKNGKGKTHKVHRLVAECFLKKKKKDYNIVNHIDCNKLNNKTGNLEWCDYSHNNKEAYKNGLKEKNRVWIKECNKRKRRKILQYDKNDNFIREWEYIQQAENELGICHINIIKSCKGQRITAGGYKWKYKNN